MLDLRPNCGGELVRRPVRPAEKLVRSPASAARVRRDKPCPDASGLVLLARGEMLLDLVAPSEPTPDKPGVFLAVTNAADRTGVNLVFRVADGRAAYGELAPRGVAFLAPPHQPSWGGWRCFARDPDGYLVEIEEP